MRDRTRLIFDIESNGLIPKMTKVHCLVTRNAATGETRRYNTQQGPTTHPCYPIEDGLKALMEADQIIGHNVIKFDIPAIQKIYPEFRPDMSKVLDTLVYARLVYADLIGIDTKLLKKETLPRHLFKSQGLEAWGHRLKKWKGDYSKVFKANFIAEHGADAWTPAREWQDWNEDMEDYCVGDTEVTQALLDKLESMTFTEEDLLDPERNYLPLFSPASVALEMSVAVIVARQERHGFCFNIKKAASLYSLLLGKKLEAEATLKAIFKPRFLKSGPVFMPKRDNKAMGYVADCPVTKVTLTEFNPGSREHIALWLKKLYGWEPMEFTEDGKAKVDETVLSQLKCPEAIALKEYLMLDKRIGQIAEGKEAWMKAERDGRIYGSVITNGAVTGRMTHSKPNLAQVPAGRSLFGHECRDLFGVPAGKVLVGADAAALELRDLAGYMARFDDGEYIEVVLRGDKSKGTDIHSVNARAIGLDPKGVYFDGESGRDIAKTWFYAFIYGAGDEKLGFIIGRNKNKARALGTESRAKFMRNLPALGALVERVKAAVRDRKHLKGLDGRVLTVRSMHAALNTLLQSAGAVQMKQALVMLDRSLQSLGYIPGINYEFVANVHDEWQIEADENIGDIVGQKAVEAIRLAGEHFNFKCPLDGEFCVGNTWAYTH